MKVLVLPNPVAAWASAGATRSISCILAQAVDKATAAKAINVLNFMYPPSPALIWRIPWLF